MDSSKQLTQTICTIHKHIRLCIEAEGSHFQNVLKLEQYKFQVSIYICFCNSSYNKSVTCESRRDIWSSGGEKSLADGI
jgi:hypothetical protein